MHKPAPKRKSQKRFEQLNEIVDVIAPTLPTASHVAVLLCCFRHGRGAGYFRASTARIAKSTALKRRRVQYILDELEAMNVIVLKAEHQGPIPRTYQIRLSVNGAPHCTIKTKTNGATPPS